MKFDGVFTSKILAWRNAVVLGIFALAVGHVDAGSYCYSSGGGYYMYCDDGCCYRYSSYYGSSNTHCCDTSSSNSLYIGLGVTFGIILIAVIMLIACHVWAKKHKNAGKVVSKNRTSPAPVKVGSTVHTAPAVPPPQPPPMQQYPMGNQNFAPPPGHQPYGYPPPPNQPPPMGSDPVYPPPPVYPYGGGGAGPY